jgi:hypothetical protein
MAKMIWRIMFSTIHRITSPDSPRITIGRPRASQHAGSQEGPRPPPVDPRPVSGCIQDRPEPPYEPQEANVTEILRTDTETHKSNPRSHKCASRVLSEHSKSIPTAHKEASTLPQQRTKVILADSGDDFRCESYAYFRCSVGEQFEDAV